MSDCGCIYVTADWYLPTFYSIKKPKARKEHTCNECGQTIKVGDHYEKVTAKWPEDSGRIRTYKTCLNCLTIRDSFFCEHFYFGNIWDEMREHISEFDGQISEDCIAKLHKGARDILCEAIQEFWELNGELFDDEED